jgi:hypothetical protein
VKKSAQSSSDFTNGMVNSRRETRPAGRRALYYTADGHTCLRYGGREDMEGAPALRQGRCTNNFTVEIFARKAGSGKKGRGR